MSLHTKGIELFYDEIMPTPPQKKNLETFWVEKILGPKFFFTPLTFGSNRISDEVGGKNNFGRENF